jgi:hypothetical protein
MKFILFCIFIFFIFVNSKTNKNQHENENENQNQLTICNLVQNKNKLTKFENHKKKKRNQK